MGGSVVSVHGEVITGSDNPRLSEVKTATTASSNNSGSASDNELSSATNPVIFDFSASVQTENLVKSYSPSLYSSSSSSHRDGEGGSIVTPAVPSDPAFISALDENLAMSASDNALSSGVKTNSDIALSSGVATNSIVTPANSGDNPVGRSSATETTILSNLRQPPAADENSDEGDEDDEEIEVGIIGKLPPGKGTLCSCKEGPRTKSVYYVRHNDGKEEYLCKAMVQKFKYLDKWLKTGWFVLSVVGEKALADAMKEEPCECGQVDCSKFCIYEVRGWYQDRIENEWTPESHLVENEPGKAALRKWKKEKARNAARHIFRH